MYPRSLEKLIESFRMLPGVGEKTAERYALLIYESEMQDVEELASGLLDVKNNLHPCNVCGNLAEEKQCDICLDDSRRKDVIFVVQSPKDVIAMEKTSEFKGVYHVLNGLISTTKGIMPEDLSIDELVNRAQNASEIIIGTSATMDGETTAMYLSRILQTKAPDVLVTRIAHGLPSGGMLDYADEITLAHALSDRKEIK